jgi:hypothetical protein
MVNLITHGLVESNTHAQDLKRFGRSAVARTSSGNNVQKDQSLSLKFRLASKCEAAGLQVGFRLWLNSAVSKRAAKFQPFCATTSYWRYRLGTYSPVFKEFGNFVFRHELVEAEPESNLTKHRRWDRHVLR